MYIGGRFCCKFANSLKVLALEERFCYKPANQTNGTSVFFFFFFFLRGRLRTACVS
jgi:hypothetical protein